MIAAVIMMIALVVVAVASAILPPPLLPYYSHITTVFKPSGAVFTLECILMHLMVWGVLLLNG